MRRRFGRRKPAPGQNIIRIALAGNPNSGKTSIFNALTGQRQHIGNYPGVTVEKKSAIISVGEKLVEFIDLPGTYSLSAYSLEEVVSRDFVLHEKP
ncbi:MAG: 50S ribosome-binding GTPase, partial [Candidatus Marinimicrobia bacterium]|nr:50S ribosome-binding GTPase [Candidatus Neomarinimicrobiota bacterium]